MNQLFNLNQMTLITKQQVEELIDRLADKELGDVIQAKVFMPLSQELGTYSGATITLFADIGDYSTGPKVTYTRRDVLQQTVADLSLGYKEKRGSPMYYHIQSKARLSMDLLEHMHKNVFQVLPKPILIGDVLEKMKEAKVYWEYTDKSEAHLNPEQLLALWQPFGFTKSLQSIFEEAEWERTEWCQFHGAYFWRKDEHSKSCTAPSSVDYVEVPKQPAIRELFTLLLQLFPKP